ncbi:hypothetical protein NDU88_004945 [Pleurodeles waltl]|uniref:Uncharacterized protein n=1 Tax=Pleurodeles waltl TaxID=8319 RepID=A0AAV7TU34_PLEWA|nr:hypothetical protein NDU88_004945 [Pleurodeles waltl]
MSLSCQVLPCETLVETILPSKARRGEINGSVCICERAHRVKLVAVVTAAAGTLAWLHLHGNLFVETETYRVRLSAFLYLPGKVFVRTLTEPEGAILAHFSRVVLRSGCPTL